MLLGLPSTHLSPLVNPTSLNLQILLVRGSHINLGLAAEAADTHHHSVSVPGIFKLKLNAVWLCSMAGGYEQNTNGKNMEIQA